MKQESTFEGLWPEIIVSGIIMSQMLEGWINKPLTLASFSSHLHIDLSAVSLFFSCKPVSWLHQLEQLVEDGLWLKAQVPSRCCMWSGHKQRCTLLLLPGQMKERHFLSRCQASGSFMIFLWTSLKYAHWGRGIYRIPADSVYLTGKVARGRAW